MTNASYCGALARNVFRSYASTNSCTHKHVGACKRERTAPVATEEAASSETKKVRGEGGSGSAVLSAELDHTYLLAQLPTQRLLVAFKLLGTVPFRLHSLLQRQI